MESERKGRFVSKDWLSLFLTLGWWGRGGGEKVLFRVYVTIKFTLSPVTSL